MEPNTTDRWTIEQVMECDWLKSMLKDKMALTPDEQKALDEAIAYRKGLETHLNSGAGPSRVGSTLSKISITINKKEFKNSPFNQSETNELLATEAN